tara:strand:- start:531 stop:1310 length:780 start_codon:yes stop_codon:yes gene_type:complete
MYVHNLDPILIDLGIVSLRWYSLSYILGILIGWWYGKFIIVKIINKEQKNLDLSHFDDLISYIIISIIVGGRLGYVIFYNFDFYLNNPSEIFKVWKGGMSFHGALIGVILGCYFFSINKKIKIFHLLDVLACVTPIGLFLGRIANFINGELYGKVTNLSYGVIFPEVDNSLRHPSQLYEAFLEGVILFLIVNFFMLKKKYLDGFCSSIFLIIYGISRIISEIFREPDQQIGYILNLFTLGSILSFFMIIFGILILTRLK